MVAFPRSIKVAPHAALYISRNSALGPSIESLINWAFLKCEMSGGTPQQVDAATGAVVGRQLSPPTETLEPRPK